MLCYAMLCYTLQCNAFVYSFILLFHTTICVCSSRIQKRFLLREVVQLNDLTSYPFSGQNYKPENGIGEASDIEMLVQSNQNKNQ